MNGEKYKRHSQGEVEYHSLCGPIKVGRFVYRKVGVHASHRRPPARSTLERMAKKIGTMAKQEAPTILKEQRRLKRQDGLNATNAEILRIHLTYIKNNKHLMRYATLKKNGLPTGSGATEGACKSLIMIRAKGCGQRWHSKGVNSVLTLRGLYQSERLSTFWKKMNEMNTVSIQKAA